jgi:hypothetical protein
MLLCNFYKVHHKMAAKTLYHLEYSEFAPTLKLKHLHLPKICVHRNKIL